MSTNTEPGKVEAFMDEATITGKMKVKLAASKHCSAFDIHVETNGRTLTLSGTVNSQQAYDEAVELAKNIAGVEDVKANLQINSDASY